MNQILVVDDDEDVREMILLVLRLHGFTAEGAIDGLDAIEQLQHGLRPGLVLLDVAMPRLDGAGFLRAVDGDPMLRDIPVVVLSGDVSARRAGGTPRACGCLLKPIDVQALIAAVERFLEPAQPAPEPP